MNSMPKLFEGAKPFESDVALILYGNFVPSVCCLRGCSSSATKNAARASAWVMKCSMGILASNISSLDRCSSLLMFLEAFCVDRGLMANVSSSRVKPWLIGLFESAAASLQPCVVTYSSLTYSREFRAYGTGLASIQLPTRKFGSKALIWGFFLSTSLHQALSCSSASLSRWARRPFFFSNIFSCAS